MESNYRYFNRDISWLSFNHRVLMEAADPSVYLYDRINFMAIYSSNLEEFYKVRVAEHKAEQDLRKVAKWYNDKYRLYGYCCPPELLFDLED